MIVTCGLSKSGKTTLIESADVSKLGWEHLRGSKILSSGNRLTSNLRSYDVLPNQEYICEYFLNYYKGNKGRVLFDGHLLIETFDGPQLVPDTILEALSVDAFAFVAADPQIIASRRNGTDLAKSIEEISALIRIEQLHASRMARRLKKPLGEFLDTDTDKFMKFLSEF